MVHGISSLISPRTIAHASHGAPQPASSAGSPKSTAPSFGALFNGAVNGRQRNGAAPAVNTSTVTATPAKAATATSAGAPTLPPAVQTAATEPSGPPKNPTAESVFGPNPFLANPTGSGPNGLIYSYNPLYFATPQAAAKVAQMVGGTVAESNMFTPLGGPFMQQQPCQMVKLANGREINAGVIVSFFTHNYPQSYIDALIANEVNNT